MIDSKAVVQRQHVASLGVPETHSADSLAITKSIIDFLKWYRENLHQAGSFPLISEDHNGFLAVNKKACSDYLHFLQSSLFINNHYVSDWQKYFDDQAKKVKKDKLVDEVPEGFDFDFVLFTQEPEIVLDGIERLKFRVTNIDGDVAYVSMDLPSDDYQFSLLMQHGKTGWQISRIKRLDLK